MDTEATAGTARLRSIRFRKATLLCCTALTLMPAVSLAQDSGGAGNATLLDRVTLETAANPVGPDDGVVAERTAVGSKTDTPILDVAASVSVITEAEMEKRGDVKLVSIGTPAGT